MTDENKPKAAQEAAKGDSKKPVVKESTRFKRIRNTLRARERHIFTVVASKSKTKRAIAAAKVVFHELRRHYELTRPSLMKHVSDQGRRSHAKQHRVDLKRVVHMQRHAMAYSYSDKLKLGYHIVRTESAWRKARQKQDYKIVEPYFTDLLAHIRETGARKAEILGFDSTYDALVDEFIPAGYRDNFDRMIDELDQWLPELVKKSAILGTAKKPPPETWELSPAIQEDLARRIRDKMGLKGAVSLGQSEHPLCLGAKGDIKVTLRYDRKDFIPAMLSAVHEYGHALYREHLPDEWQHHPAGEVPSQSMDEAMALIMENHVGRNRGFAEFLVRVLKEEYGIERPGLTADAIMNRVTEIGTTKIRGDSDELSYPIHVMLRYKIGRELADGKLEAKDLPKRWREMERHYFGWESENDLEGCLQDIHWFSGQLGYFPSYFMGAMTAAQLYEAFGKQNPAGLKLAEKDFDISGLTEWLEENVYVHASDKETEELIRDVTGKDLSTEAYKRVAQKKYRPHQRMLSQKLKNFLGLGEKPGNNTNNNAIIDVSKPEQNAANNAPAASSRNNNGNNNPNDAENIMPPKGPGASGADSILRRYIKTPFNSPKGPRRKKIVFPDFNK